MLKSKLFQIVVAMLIVITLILVAFFTLWTYMDKKTGAGSGDPVQQAAASSQPKEVSADKLKELTVVMKDILTNLSEKNKVVSAEFTFEMTDKKAKTEFENLDFKVRAVINQTLADLTSEQVSGSKGQDNLVSTIMNKINPMLQEGKIKQVWITKWIVQ